MANFLSVGTGFYIFNAFMEPLQKARGWSRTDINIALVIGMFFGILSQFIYGGLVTWLGPRLLMFLGPFLSGTAFILLFRTEHIGFFYLWCMVLFMGNAAYGGIVSNTAVSNWFEEKRGRALGFATAGVSFSGAVLPFIAMMIILHSGLSQAAIQIGLLITLFGPLAWMVVRNWPEEHGLLPDGKSPESLELQASSSTNYPAAEPILHIKELLRMGAFWKIGLSFGLGMIGIVGVMTQLKPRFVDEGFGDLKGMGLMAATALIGAFGKYFWGALCDRYDSRRVVASLFLLNAIGLLFSLIHGELLALMLFILIFGFAMGGIMSTYPIIVADFFGRKQFPSVMKFISFFFLIQVSGYVISGQSFDHTGSYDLAYKIYILLFFAAFILLGSVKRPPNEDLLAG